MPSCPGGPRESRCGARSCVCHQHRLSSKYCIYIWAIHLAPPIRLQQIEAESTASIEPFVREVVEPGSVLRTDGAAIYRRLREDYQHERTVVKSVMPDAIPA